MFLDPITTFDLVTDSHRARVRAAAHHRQAVDPDASVRRRHRRRAAHPIVSLRPGPR